MAVPRQEQRARLAPREPHGGALPFLRGQQLAHDAYAGRILAAGAGIHARRLAGGGRALAQREDERVVVAAVQHERRVVARIEATPLGLDVRYVVTSLEAASPEDIYARLYCARGQAENLIKLHKTQLKSDRTSCRSPLANQMRLILHTAAYWLMLTVRDAVPKTHVLAKAEFATGQLQHRP